MPRGYTGVAPISRLDKWATVTLKIMDILNKLEQQLKKGIDTEAEVSTF